MPEPRLTRVLVVDDDPLLCELLRVTLAIEGIEVTAAHHVIHAEKLLAESVPDAIVLDIGLPGVDGVFYCERLRESPRTKRLPIIAISGSEDAGVMSVAAGADAFVHKPFDPLQRTFRQIDPTHQCRPFIRVHSNVLPDVRALKLGVLVIAQERNGGS